MMGLFSRRRKASADTGGLGDTLIALRLDSGDVAPAGATVVVFNASGHARRAAAGRVSCEPGEVAFGFHPGPYTMDLVPFLAAPEWGLRLRFLVDAADPRVSQQRFDLYLHSETAGRLSLADFGAAVQMALQAELAQGALELPACTTLEEWHAFRAGLNQLMYTRYGVTVDDCVPVDLGEQVDYAAMLQQRAQEPHRLAQEQTANAAPSAQDSPDSSRYTASLSAPAQPSPTARAPATGALDAASLHEPVANDESAAAPGFADRDARALRRLFLELPALGSELRLLTLPDGLPLFQQHQAILLRLGMAALNVNTMPSLAWSAPDQPLPAQAQASRSVHTLIAQTALDEGWSLLARLQLADEEQWPALLDEADRICANLETGLALRRMPHAPRMEPSL